MGDVVPRCSLHSHLVTDVKCEVFALSKITDSGLQTTRMYRDPVRLGRGNAQGEIGVT